MRHAIHSDFQGELIKFSNTFTFKPSPYNPQYIEINTWPTNLSAKGAKDYLLDKGISIVALDTNGSEIEEWEECVC